MEIRKNPLVLRASLKTKRILAVSDIHGDRVLLERLLKKLRYVPGEDSLILIGDYVNRGEENLDTVRLVMELCRNENVFALRGNNDIFLFEDRTEEVFDHLRHYGSRSLLGDMLREAGISEPETPEELPAARERAAALFPREMEFLTGLPDILETERFYFAHAGLESEDLEAQRLEYVLSAPRFHETGGHVFSKLLLVGHWPTANYRHDRLSNAPLYNGEKNILSIDGGNRIKWIGQLNGVVIDSETGGWSWDSVDFLPEIPAPVSQRERAGAVVAWPENKVEMLERGERLSRCRVLHTGEVLEIPNSFLFEWEGWLCTGDITGRRLEIQKGEPLGVLEDAGECMVVRRGSEIGMLYLSGREEHGEESV